MADIAGVYSASSSTTVTYADWWLINPLDPTYNQVITLANNSFQRTRKEEQSLYEPLGRALPIVIRGSIRGEKFQLVIELLTLAAWDAFENLRNQQATLLLQRGYTGEQWYGVLGPERRIDEPIKSDPNYKLIDIEFIETDAP